MAYLLPNHLLPSDSAVELEDTVFAAYSSKVKNDNLEVRITTHCLIILFEGRKIINFDHADVNVAAGEMVFLTQNNYFMSEIITQRGEYHALLIYFNDRFIEQFLTKHAIAVGRSEKRRDFFKTSYRDSDIFSLNVQLLHRYIREGKRRLLVMKLEEILLNCLDTAPFGEYLNAIAATRPVRVSNIIESNLDLIETVEDMCRLTGRSPGQLRKYFLQRYAMTPKKWLDEKRLQKAMVLLRSSDMTIAQIAQGCGYATLSWFSHCFKQRYGKRPKEIRQEA